MITRSFLVQAILCIFIVSLQLRYKIIDDDYNLDYKQRMQVD